MKNLNSCFILTQSYKKRMKLHEILSKVENEEEGNSLDLKNLYISNSRSVGSIYDSLLLSVINELRVEWAMMILGQVPPAASEITAE